MERVRKGWYEREEVKKVTLDWVKTNCKLTDREIELLKLIYDRKMVRRDHLEIISPSYRYSGKNRTQILNKSIRKLFEKMCIDKVHEEREIGDGGNNPCIVSLDRGGSLFLGVQHKRRIIHHKSKNHIKRRLPSNYRHINGVNQLEVDTILFCEDTNSEIVEWVHEKPQEIHYGEERLMVISDILMQLKFGREPSKPFYAFLEYDTGSESIRYKNPPIIRDKVIKYKKYKSSEIWKDEYPYFPLLLFITEEEGRIDFFNKKCREIGVEGFGIYYKNYIDFLKRLATIV